MARVVVTGLGLWTPLGGNVDDNWTALGGPSPALAGTPRATFTSVEAVPSVQRRIGPMVSLKGEGLHPGVEVISCRRPSPFREKVAARPDEGFDGARKMAEAAALEALTDAGLWDGDKLLCDPERVGCTVSASKPLTVSSPAAVSARHYGFGGHPLSTNDVVVDGWIPPDELSQAVVRRFDIRGECRNVIAACATGAYAIALAAGWIESGLCDVALAGSAEPWPHPLIEAGFRNMGVLSDEPVMRPFDRRRSGFVFGAGAGVVVLEGEEHYRRRRKNGGDRNFLNKPTTRRRSPPSNPYAVLSGWGLGADTHSSVAFNSNGRHIADVIDRALVRAKLQAPDISYVHAHGTATRLNDWIETQALMKAFGSHAGRLMISATKGSTGHMLGAAGSVGFIFTVLALKNQFVPPTATLEQPDPECPLDYTPGRGHSARVEHAMALSFGFGGPIGALVVSQ